MNRTTVSHDGRPTRPWLVRVAHAWYSWVVLAATVIATYLAANGELRVGNAAQLQAAPQDNITWKPTATPTDADAGRPAPLPLPDMSGDPFKAAAPAASPRNSTESNADSPVARDPFVATPAVKPALDKKVSEVLNAYKGEKDIVPAKTAEKSPLSNLPPPVSANVKQESPAVGPLLPVPPKDDAAPPKTGPALLPALSGSEIPAATEGVKLPPIPPPPAPLPLPPIVNKDSGKVIPGHLLAQEPEKLTIPPKPVEGPAPKAAPEPKKRKIIGTLTQEDEIKLNAAQNAARLRDFNRAAALMAEVIRNNPEEYDLRAEYAGILLSAGDYRGAIRELEAVIKLAPNVAGYRLLLGDALMAAQQFRFAADVYLTALEMIAQEPRLAERVPEVVVRAARAYALDQEYFRAAHLVDKHLADIKPDDPRAPLAMGAVLLDLDRPYDALPYIIEKRKQLLASPEATEEFEQKVLEVLASLVRGFARVTDREQALAAVQEMTKYAPKQLDVRNTLADILFDLNEFELAGHVLNQVLAVDPGNSAALINVARVYIETYQTAAAKKVLDSFIPAPKLHREYLLAYSSYHQTIGEYAEAKQIYRDMLRRNENDSDVRFGLGRIYEYTFEFEKAKAEFAKIVPTERIARKARLWFGYTLLEQRKWVEAAQVADQFIKDDPNNAEGLALLIRALSKMGQFDKAVQVGRGYLSTNPRDDRGVATVRLAVGRALLEANRNLEAAREFEIALSKPAGRVPEAYYGLARAAEKLGNVDRAQQIITTLCGPGTMDVRSRMAIADQFAKDHEPQKVLEVIAPLTASEPNSLPVLIRLADAQQSTSQWSGNPVEAFQTCQQIIRQSPTNVRGHMAMARSFGVTQNFRKATIQYDQIIAIDPDYAIPYRERARGLVSDKQYSAARSTYNVVLSPTPEQIIMNQMAYLVQKDPRYRQVFAPYMSGGLNGPALRAELARIAGGCPDEEVRLAAHRMICDYDGTLAWHEAFRLERDSSELKDYRNFMAVPQQHAAIAFEPTNTQATFDLGQTYGALKMTRAALNWYQNTLAIDPQLRDAAVASERASAEISPKFDARFDYFHQRGFDNLASIDRFRYIAAGSVPLGDEDEYFMAGYMRLAYNPLDGPQAWGNAPFLRAQKRWDDHRLLTYGQVNLEYFDRYFETRPTFDVGSWYAHNDVLRTNCGLYLENVAENGESMRQDIFRYGFYLGANVMPTRVWNFGGAYRYAHYSDQNDAHLAFLYNDISLTLPPKQLKLVQRANMMAFAEPTIFPTNPPNPNILFGAVHPYFAPDFFGICEARVEWWHWLSRDYFVHSNQCYYSLQYAIATDNNLVTYNEFRALLNYDVNSCLTIGVDARAITSDVYDMFQAMAFLQVRFLAP